MPLSTFLATDSHHPDQNRAAGEWASQRIWGRTDGFKDYCTLTVLRNGEVIAVVVLHNWQPDCGTIEISAAGANGWQSRGVIRHVMGICFEDMGCQLVLMRNSSKDEATVSNSRRLGFSGTLLPRMRGRDEDEWLFTLTDDDWRKSRLYRPKKQ